MGQYSHFVVKTNGKSNWKLKAISLVVGTMLYSSVLYAQETTINLNLAAQPLHQAVDQLARQGNIQILYASDVLANHNISALSGQYTVEQALQRLLQGTNLTVQKNGNVWSIVAQGDSSSHQQVEQAQHSLAPIKLSTIVVTAEDDDIYNKPKAVHTVTREKLDRVPPTSTADIFKGIPGVQMANARSGASFDPNIRGAQGHGRVKVIVDGAESTTQSRVTYAGNRSHNYIDPDFISGIEVEKGTSLETGAFGGSISIKTFDAKDLIIDPDKNWGIRIKGMVGNNSSNDAHENVQLCSSTSITTANPTPTVSSGLTDSTNIGRCNENATVVTTNNRTGVTTTRTYSWQDYDTGIGSIDDRNMTGSIIGAWQPLDNLELVGGYSYRTTGNYSAGKNGFLDLDFPTNGGYWFDGRPKKGVSFWHLGDEVYGSASQTESWLFKTKYILGDHEFGINYNQLDSTYIQQTNVNPQLSPTVDIIYAPFSQTEQQRYNIEYKYKPDNDLISIQANTYLSHIDEHTYTMNSSFVYGFYDVKTEIFGVNLTNTSLFDIYSMPLTLRVGGNYKEDKATGDTEVNGVEKKEYGLFTHANLGITHWLIADVGLRYNDYKITIDAENNTYRFAEGNSDSGTSYQYGLTLIPLNGVQLFARMSESWRSPSSRESTLNNCAQGYYSTVNGLGNIVYSCTGQGLLKPEQSETLEFGVNLAFDNLFFYKDKLGVKATRFENKYKDYLYGSGTTFLPYINIDKVEYSGYELSLNYKMPWVFLEYSYTRYDKQKYCGTSLYDPDSCTSSTGIDALSSLYKPAKRTEYLTVGTTLFDDRLTFGMNMNFVNGTGFHNGLYGLNEYEVYDLFASFKLNQYVDLGLSVENLKDKYYFDAGFDYMTAIPAPGRTGRFTVTYKF